MTEPRRVAIITSIPRLAEPFLRDPARHRRMGIEIPLVVRIRPSMRFHHRLRDLWAVLRRQARINGTHPLVQAVHYFTYRRLSGWARRPAPDAAIEALGRDGRRVVEVESANDQDAVAALRDSRVALAVVVGADVLDRSTLDALEMPLYNVHMSDPAFVRGLPIAFWEIHDDRDSMRLTLHELVAALDSGAILAQRDSPIVWGPTLSETLRRTGKATGDGVAELLAEAIPAILDGAVEPRPVVPGPLRTTPTVRQTLRARRVCRRRSAGST